MKIRYCYNGRTKSDDLENGTVSNYRLDLKTIEILMDRCSRENIP